MDTLKDICKALGCLGLMVLVGMLFVARVVWGSGAYADVYETDNPADYKQVVGNYLNDDPQWLVDSFFPETLEADFQDLRYRYKAIKCDATACEMWLEFTVEDRARVEALLRGPAEGRSFVPFQDGWEQIVIEDTLELLRTDDGLTLEYARMGRILYRESDNRLIFWAMSVFDGGGTEAKDLSRFFSYFDIDPAAIADTIYE